MLPHVGNIFGVYMYMYIYIYMYVCIYRSTNPMNTPIHSLQTVVVTWVALGWLRPEAPDKHYKTAAVLTTTKMQPSRLRL